MGMNFLAKFTIQGTKEQEHQEIRLMKPLYNLYAYNLFKIDH